MSQAQQERSVIAISGTDRAAFLQGLVSNDVAKLKDGLVYAALLNPQGKYLADFFLVPGEDQILLDVAQHLSPMLMKRLSLYKLRADVTITQTDLCVARGLGAVPAGAFQDPRHQALGWRAYDGRASLAADWEALRVAYTIPESGIELIPEDSYLLEMGFERLSGVDFRKGCYVGQEVTARMKHKTELRKGLAKVQIDAPVACGTALECDGKPVGTIFTSNGNEALAYLRFDRAEGNMQAGAATVRLA